MSESIYAQLQAAGVPLDHHESDLYAKVTLQSSRIVAAYAHTRPFGGPVKTFISQIDNQLWYDIPFAYAPFWEAKSR